MMQTPQSLGLIVNANAGRVRAHLLTKDRFWEGLLPEASVRITRTLPELHAAVSAFEAQGVGVVACLGGDGTLNRTVGALLQRYGGEGTPAVFPLAGGPSTAWGVHTAPQALPRRGFAPPSPRRPQARSGPALGAS
jgi:Diacylglycerol kinase catalytic domain